MYQRRRVVALRTNNSVRRTYDLIRSSLHHSLQPGSALVEEELVDSLSSSRNAVRSALQLLAKEGLLARGPKTGTTSLGSTLLPFSELLTAVERAVYGMQTEALEMTVIPASAILRKWLDLPPGASVAMIEGLLIQDGTKIGLSVSYVGLTTDEQTLLSGQPPDPLSLLEDVLQVELGDAETTVAAVIADAQTAELLGIPEGSPMLWLEDLLRDIDGRPRAISQLHYRADRIAFSATAHRPTLAR